MRFYSVMIPRHDSRLSALSTTQTRGTLASRVSFSLWLPTGSPAGAGWLSERPRPCTLTHWQPSSPA